MDLAEKQRIVTVLNRRHGTLVPLNVVEVAVALGMTTWDQLAAEIADE